MSQKETGAVRSADSDQLDFTSLPIIGLFGVARTAKEGATKYARLNYMKGFPVHDILNHALIHVYMYLAGDRSEPNLEHAAWGLLAAVQQQTLSPELSEAHLLGPGASLTEANLDYLAEQEAVLGPKRASGEFAGIGDWKLEEVPQIAKLLMQRPLAKEQINKLLKDIPYRQSKGNRYIHAKALARCEGKGGLARSDLEQAVKNGDITQEEFNTWNDGGPFPDFFTKWNDPRFLVKFDGKLMFNSPTMEYMKGGPEGPVEIVRPKQGTFSFEAGKALDGDFEVEFGKAYPDASSEPRHRCCHCPDVNGNGCTLSECHAPDCGSKVNGWPCFTLGGCAESFLPTHSVNPSVPTPTRELDELSSKIDDVLGPDDRTVTFNEMDGVTTQSRARTPRVEITVTKVEGTDTLARLEKAGHDVAMRTFNGLPKTYFHDARSRKITPTSEGGDHMGGCPPLP